MTNLLVGEPSLVSTAVKLPLAALVGFFSHGPDLEAWLTIIIIMNRLDQCQRGRGACLVEQSSRRNAPHDPMNFVASWNRYFVLVRVVQANILVVFIA